MISTFPLQFAPTSSIVASDHTMREFAHTQVNRPIGADLSALHRLGWLSGWACQIRSHHDRIGIVGDAVSEGVRQHVSVKHSHLDESTVECGVHVDISRNASSVELPGKSTSELLGLSAVSYTHLTLPTIL